jgi:hypothetical protein
MKQQLEANEGPMHKIISKRRVREAKIGMWSTNGKKREKKSPETSTSNGFQNKVCSNGERLGGGRGAKRFDW